MVEMDDFHILVDLRSGKKLNHTMADGKCLSKINFHKSQFEFWCHLIKISSHLKVNVAHSFLYRFAVEHIFMPVECCRLLKLSHPFSKWTRPSPGTNQKAHQTIAFMNNCKRCVRENINLSSWHKYMFNWHKVFKDFS